MAGPTCTFDGLDINDGTVYSILPGVTRGGKRVSFSEVLAYDGSVGQEDATTASFVQMVIPLKIEGSSVADLWGKIDAINAKIAAADSSAPLHLVYQGTTYHVVASDQIAPSLDLAYMGKYIAMGDLILNRQP